MCNSRISDLLLQNPNIHITSLSVFKTSQRFIRLFIRLYIVNTFPYIFLQLHSPWYHQTQQAIELLVKFEEIRGPQLELKEKYMKVIAKYSHDLEDVRKLYQKQKNEPFVPRNLPPVAGRIAWARQLYRKIEMPMKHFKKKPDILKVNLSSR